MRTFTELYKKGQDQGTQFGFVTKLILYLIAIGVVIFIVFSLLRRYFG